jgi:hypothetical protein
MAGAVAGQPNDVDRGSAVTDLATGRPELPMIPPPWPLPPAQMLTLDYAEAALADAWLRHPLLGDPSFDAFERLPGNPLVRGEAPFRWPVNAFLLIDPVSGHWFAYVGFYLEGYDFGPDKAPAHCRVFRSTDNGRSWSALGPVFDDPNFRFEGDTATANLAPDVSVVYADGRYHMAYDWATDNTTWATAVSPRDGADNGVAYAWADKPEGPFHRAPRPVLRTSELQHAFPASGKYRRAYATSLVRRQRDWLVLTDVDSGPFFAWGQVAMTAADPSGPWSAPALVTGLEGEGYFPAPVESFPAFVHGGYLYDPKTSVGANRNFQVIHRARLEEAHRPEAWTLYQHGTVWHAEPVPHEGFGIWGQAFAGAVDRDGNLRALFPSRHWPDSVGTINLATRPWDTPLRERGFVFSAHSGPSVTVTRSAYTGFALAADFSLRGTSVRFAWGYSAPLGTVGRADGKPQPLSWTRHQGVEIGPTSWRVLRTEDTPEPQVLATGELPAAEVRHLEIAVAATGAVRLALEGRELWQGPCPARPGPLALLLQPGTHLTVTRFAVTGAPLPATWTWLASEAIAGAGVSEGHYTATDSSDFRFGSGVVCARPDERLKWNFRGRGFRLWLPKGPTYGRCTVRLNGLTLGDLDLHSATTLPATVVLERRGLADGYHALVIQSLGAALPADCLDAQM